MFVLTVRWLLAGALLVLFALAAIGNIIGPIQAGRTGKNFSMAPVIGGLAGMLGLLLAPAAEFQRWWWAPLVLDLGSGFFLIGCLIAVVVWGFRRLTRPNGSNRS